MNKIYSNINIILGFWVLAILLPCTHEKLLLQYYVNNRYSDFSCMSMWSSELFDLEKFLGNVNWTFPKFINKFVICLFSVYRLTALLLVHVLIVLWKCLTHCFTVLCMYKIYFKIKCPIKVKQLWMCYIILSNMMQYQKSPVKWSDHVKITG